MWINSSDGRLVFVTVSCDTYIPIVVFLMFLFLFRISLELCVSMWINSSDGSLIFVTVSCDIFL